MCCGDVALSVATRRTPSIDFVDLDTLAEM
jgi:hypothetical protein